MENKIYLVKEFFVDEENYSKKILKVFNKLSNAKKYKNELENFDKIAESNFEKQRLKCKECQKDCGSIVKKIDKKIGKTKENLRIVCNYLNKKCSIGSVRIDEGLEGDSDFHLYCNERHYGYYCDDCSTFYEIEEYKVEDINKS